MGLAIEAEEVVQLFALGLYKATIIASQVRCSVAPSKESRVESSTGQVLRRFLRRLLLCEIESWRDQQRSWMADSLADPMPHGLSGPE